MGGGGWGYNLIYKVFGYGRCLVIRDGGWVDRYRVKVSEEECCVFLERCTFVLCFSFRIFLGCYEDYLS